MESTSRYNSDFDISFVYAYNWSEPENDLDLALSILSCPGVAGEYTAEDPCLAMASETDRIRCTLASNPLTPSAALAHLASCDAPMVLERIAENPRTDTGTLARLARSDFVNVRASVAENLNTPAEVLRWLSVDEGIDVRFAVAENVNAPVEILELLQEDENPYVAHRAQTTLLKTQTFNEASSEPAQIDLRRFEGKARRIRGS